MTLKILKTPNALAQMRLIVVTDVSPMHQQIMEPVNVMQDGKDFLVTTGLEIVIQTALEAVGDQQTLSAQNVKMEVLQIVIILAIAVQVGSEFSAHNMVAYVLPAVKYVLTIL
jgi:hypothetical protein